MHQEHLQLTAANNNNSNFQSIRPHQQNHISGIMGSADEMGAGSRAAALSMREPHDSARSHHDGLMEPMIPVSISSSQQQPQEAGTVHDQNHHQQQQLMEPHQQQQQQQEPQSAAEQWRASPHLQGIEQEVAATRHHHHSSSRRRVVTYEDACLEYLKKAMPSDEEALSSRKPARAGPRGRYTRYTGVSQVSTEQHDDRRRIIRFERNISRLLRSPRASYGSVLRRE